MQNMVRVLLRKCEGQKFATYFFVWSMVSFNSQGMNLLNYHNYKAGYSKNAHTCLALAKNLLFLHTTTSSCCQFPVVSPGGVLEARGVVVCMDIIMFINLNTLQTFLTLFLTLFQLSCLHVTTKFHARSLLPLM